MPGDSDVQRELDDAYHEYLWGESSPRAFARRRKFGAKSAVSRYEVVEVQVGAEADPAGFVPR